ncbi:YlzJ-like family protein [Bacillus andreraoultii]|uniref:YlzJ-like family protein n=1 Tax=Bacillus andreraoultii TaxID=1499685 RepID=UPI00053B0A47|nr:YlzJ-like family protein [Bacillus andreraoultii]
MILHTTIPAELIFQQEQSPKNEKTILYQGIPLVIEMVNDSQFQVKQIVSTDPKHYLESKIYPGAILSIW